MAPMCPTHRSHSVRRLGTQKPAHHPGLWHLVSAARGEGVCLKRQRLAEQGCGGQRSQQADARLGPHWDWAQDARLGLRLCRHPNCALGKGSPTPGGTPASQPLAGKRTVKREAHRSSARAPGGAAPPGAGHRHLLRLASALHAASLRLLLLLGVYVSVTHVWPMSQGSRMSRCCTCFERGLLCCAPVPCAASDTTFQRLRCGFQNPHPTTHCSAWMECECSHHLLPKRFTVNLLRS